MLADVPSNLQAFFVPQVEQLRMVEVPAAAAVETPAGPLATASIAAPAPVPSPCGGAAVLDEDMGDGYLEVVGLGADCLLSAHDFVLRDDFLLREYPTESYCLSLMSGATAGAALAACGPAAASAASETTLTREGNVLPLYQDGSPTEFVLPAGIRCWAVTLCFTPRYLEHASSLLGVNPQAACDALLASRPNELPREVRRCLRSLRRPASGSSSSPPLSYAPIAFEALASVVKAHLEDRPVDRASADGSGPPSCPCAAGGLHAADDPNVRLVESALLFMEARLGRKVTVAGLARELYVSKTTLCSAFRKVKGVGVAECLQTMRIERAKELLATTDASIGEIARTVGYRHQSSFCHAFKATCGIAPSEFRGEALPTGD